MPATLDSAIPTAAANAAFGHRLAPPGDPLEGATFEAIYEQKIKPELEKCEAERRGAVRLFFLALAAGALLVFLENMMAPSVTGHPGATVDLRVALPTLVLACALGYVPLARVARSAKVSVICSLCEPLGVTYRDAGFEAPAFDTFLSLNLLPKPTSKAFQDLFTGRRGDVAFALCEATISQGSGKSRTVVFQGQLFRLVTPRRLASTTVVLRNSGWLQKFFECPKGLSPVGLEDPSFNQSFRVFGQDQVEAREVLTPTFMERLTALETAYAGGHIRCAFDATQLLIALECPNRFEIGGMFSNLVDRSRVEGVARNIEQVFQMIDEFRDA